MNARIAGSLASLFLMLGGCAHAQSAPPVARPGALSQFTAPLLEVEASGSIVCALGYAQRVQCASVDESPMRVVEVPGTEDAVELALGGGRGCVATGAGEVACFSIDRGRPGSAVVIAGVEDAAEVALGDGMGCARQFDGRVTCWTAQRGPERVATLESAESIAAVDDGACALRADGRVACWDGSLEAGVVPGLEDIVAIASGPEGTVAIGVDGRVSMFHSFGGGVFAPAVPVASVPGAVDAAMASDAGCVRTADGAAHCWGLREGAARRDAALEGARSVAVGEGFACAVRGDGAMRCRRADVPRDRETSAWSSW